VHALRPDGLSRSGSRTALAERVQHSVAEQVGRLGPGRPAIGGYPSSRSMARLMSGTFAPLVSLRDRCCSRAPRFGRLHLRVHAASHHPALEQRDRALPDNETMREWPGRASMLFGFAVLPAVSGHGAGKMLHADLLTSRVEQRARLPPS
jgi:hypothetical protein